MQYAFFVELHFFLSLLAESVYFLEKVVVIHRLSHHVITCDVDRDVSTAYC